MSRKLAEAQERSSQAIASAQARVASITQEIKDKESLQKNAQTARDKIESICVKALPLAGEARGIDFIKPDAKMKLANKFNEVYSLCENIKTQVSEQTIKVAGEIADLKTQKAAAQGQVDSLKKYRRRISRRNEPQRFYSRQRRSSVGRREYALLRKLSSLLDD